MNVVIGACLIWSAVPRLSAQVPIELPPGRSHRLATGAKPMDGFAMRASETSDGNSIISFDELLSRKAIPELAWNPAFAGGPSV